MNIQRRLNIDYNIETLQSCKKSERKFDRAKITHVIHYI